MVYNVKDFGAVRDGFRNDGPSIQSAIDECHKNGGGQVCLEGGHTYRAGTLVLRSFVELHLEMGAILKGSDHLESLLFLEHISHLTLQQVTLTGSAFWTTHLVGCEDVLVEGVRILNNLKMANCDGIDPDHCIPLALLQVKLQTSHFALAFLSGLGRGNSGSPDI